MFEWARKATRATFGLYRVTSSYVQVFGVGYDSGNRIDRAPEAGPVWNRNANKQ